MTRRDRLHLAACFTLATLLACVAVGQLLIRLDHARTTAEAARAETRLLRAEMTSAFIQRDIKPDNVDPVDAVCRLRTLALRGALLALVRTGAVAMPNNPGGEWASWGVEPVR